MTEAGKKTKHSGLQMIFVSILVLCIVCTAFADGQDERMNYAQFSFNNITLNYALYAPEDVTDSMPMIVFLHGSHGRGDDIEQAVDHGFPRFLVNGELGNVPDWILMPQLPSEADGWEQYNDAVIALIRYVCETYHVDTARISLTGHSMGGIGSWRLAVRNPGFFSCIVPVSGKLSASESELQILSVIPARAYIGDEDLQELFQEENTVNMETLTESNDDFVFTVVDHADHSRVSKKVYTANLIPYSLDSGATVMLPEIIVWLLSHSL